MIELGRVLLRLNADLRKLKVDWAIVGGFAVSIRAQPRTTLDIDVAISAASDSDAETLIRNMTQLEYSVDRILEQDAVGRLAGVRLMPPVEVNSHAPIDVLFASSGIEVDIVGQAEWMETIKGVKLPVARAGHLIALKILAENSRRPQDRIDAMELLAVSSPSEIELARVSLDRIERRGYHRNKDLQSDFRILLRDFETRKR